jgi:hypothetical protein
MQSWLLKYPRDDVTCQWDASFSQSPHGIEYTAWVFWFVWQSERRRCIDWWQSFIRNLRKEKPVFSISLYPFLLRIGGLNRKLNGKTLFSLHRWLKYKWLRYYIPLANRHHHPYSKHDYSYFNTNLHVDELSKPRNNILTIFFSYRFKVCSFTATRYINHVSLATLV